MEIILTVLTFAYILAGIIGTIGYLPTIKDAIEKKSTANIKSYIIWTATSGITFAYAIIILADIPIKITTGLTFTACLTILTFTLNQNKVHKTI